MTGNQPRFRTAGNGPAPPALDSLEVIAGLEEYLAAIEAGTRLDRHAFLARHRHLAATLEECLDGLDALHFVPRILAEFTGK